MARRWKIGAVGLAAIVALSVLNEGQNIEVELNSFVSPPPELVPATIAAARWERHIEIEGRSFVQGTGVSLPESAQVVARQRFVERYDSVHDGYRTEYREVPETREFTEYETRTSQASEQVQTGTRTYVCGQRDLGNGYFEDRECTEPVYRTRYRTETYEAPVRRTETVTRRVREEVPVYRRVPVYGTRYQWRAPRWSVVRTASAHGDTAAPVWPEPVLASNERLGSRSERHYVILRRPGMPDRLVELRQNEWGLFRAGQRVAAYESEWATRPTILPADSLAACVRWHTGVDRANPPPDSLGCSPLTGAWADSARAAARADSARDAVRTDSLAEALN